MTINEVLVDRLYCMLDAFNTGIGGHTDDNGVDWVDVPYLTVIETIDALMLIAELEETKSLAPEDEQ